MAVQEEIYRPQLGPARTTPLPLDDGSGSAAQAIGQGMEQLGGTLHRRAVQDYQVQRRLDADREAADFAVRFAEAREKFDQFSIDRRNAAPADAAGHVDAMRTAWEAESETLLAGLRETSLINNARAQLAQYGERLVGSEVDWAEGKRVAKLVTDQQRTTMIGANRARQMHDPAAYAEEIQLGRDAIEALNVPADVKDKLTREHDQLVTIGYLNGLNDKDPLSAVALLDGGAFNEILDPAQIEQARNGAMVEVRRAEAAAAHEQQLRAAEIRDRVQVAKTSIEAGVEVDDATLAQLEGELRGIGDEGGAAGLAVLRVQNRVRRETEPWTPAQFDAEINRLTGKAKRSADEDIRLASLRKLRPAAVSTYTNNPGEWAAKIGMPPPAMSFADPASVAARLRWARAVEQSTGRPVPPLLPAEAATLHEQAAASPRGRVEVADQIATLGGYAVLQAARQIAPNDAMLGRLAQLADPMLRRAAARGADVRATRKDLIDGANGNDAKSVFNDALGQAGALMAPQDVGAAFEVARNLYAARAEGANFDERLFDQAVHEALGGTLGQHGETLGGLGSYGRHPVLLPDGMSDARFDKMMARLGGVKFGGPHQPVWSDGSAMSAQDLRAFVPVRRPDGRYEFHRPDGTVAGAKSGGALVVDLAKFARDRGL